MIQLLIDLLTPIFTSMGVSTTDVQTYVNMLSGYIYTIIGLLAAAVAIMVAAHFLVKKGTRHVVRWSAALAWVLAVAIIANIMCFGPLYNNLSPIMNTRAQVSEGSIANSKAVIREVGEEGMVLLENNGVLPLADTTNLNVFGWASTNPIFGGTGSGSSDNSSSVGILQSLTDAGISYNQEIIDMYTEYSPTRNLGGNVVSVTYTDWSLPEPPVEYYTDELMTNAQKFSDTAMIVISRSGGEGQDLPTDMNAIIHDTYDLRDSVANGNENYNYTNCNYTNNSTEYDDFDPGESYLELSNTEEAMIEKVCSAFDKVVVVINANNTMELGWVEQYPQIGAVILAPGTGESGMSALGEILNGSVNPSGRTVDTYVYDVKQTPWYNNFGSFTYNNVDDLRAALTQADPAYQGVIAFVNYVEGIYVGYKFYETAAEEGLIDYDAAVQYPFGYGLSYTSFAQEITEFSDNGDTVSLTVNVTNTGDVAGKDVVEVYFTPPYTNGGIEKASVNLVQFAKTAQLEPGASETVSFTIDKEDFASYDSGCIKTANGGYVLEAGEYALSIRSDSHTVLDSVTFTVGSDVDYSADGRPSDSAVPTNQFQDYSAGNVTYLSRADGFANYAQATAAPAQETYAMDADTLARITKKSVAYYDPTQYDDPNEEMPVTGANNGLSLADFTGKAYDDPQWEELLDQLTFDEMFNLVNLGGFQTVAMKSVGKVQTMDSDGGTGLNDWYIGVFGTSFPTAVLICQTWNTELTYRTGEALGAEFADCEIWGWYGPSMNTHRNAFCGRNFEYYSEDGVLGGYMASAMVNGGTSNGIYAYIKHFVLNDQETNRCSFLLTYSDEQAIREIYMKPFEICVKANRDMGGAAAGYPMAVMTSFNFIGDVYCGANPDLLNDVLRDEWGFQGMVLTDWDGSYGYQLTDDVVRGGGDLMLGFLQHESNQLTDRDSATLAKAMRQAAKNIFFTTVNSGAYTRSASGTGLSPMVKTFIAIDAGILAAVAAVEAIVIVRWRKKSKTKV